MATALDKPIQVARVREDFPIFAHLPQPFAYLDSAATAQKPRAVLEAVVRHLGRANANVHRGLYPLARAADEAFEGARRRIAAFTGADPKGTVFTKNATEAINLIAYAWGRENLGPGDAVLISELEHHANLVPWQQLCRERGAELRYLEIDDQGTLSLQQLQAELERGGVKLVSVAHVSNVLGTINPVAEIVSLARRAGAVTVIDGAQAVPQLPVDVKEIDADFYVWTGHKALGPTGIGVLHGRVELLQRLEPFLTGGDMIATVERQRATWNEPPWRFEAGTPPIAEAVGLAAAVEYLEGIGMERVRAHEQALGGYLLARLGEIPGLAIYGPSDPSRRAGLASFTIEGIHPHDIAELVGREGVCIRAGHHCAQPLMARLGVPATARASLALYNDEQDVDLLIAALRKAVALFNR